MSDRYLAMWCSEGLEFVVNLTAIHRERSVWALKGRPHDERPRPFPDLTSLSLRARYNSQRHYEIYGFEVSDGITENDVKEWFNADPQGAVEWIRKNGARVMSDRYEPNQTVIT